MMEPGGYFSGRAFREKLRQEAGHLIVFLAGFIRFAGEFSWYLYRTFPVLIPAGMLAFLLYLACLPKPLFEKPLSVVLEDRNGHLLGARIAADGQWRFPSLDKLPEKYVLSLLLFEDRWFYCHHGIDPTGIARAIVQNITQRRVVSGGSTLTMQVMRMAAVDGKRHIFNKIKEAIQASRLELTWSKEEILSLYAANAPFGGNVVGLEAASWRYFGKDPVHLSWAEAATLAVLPNSPALIHPGRNRDALRAKRDRLLHMLHEAGFMDAETHELALLEELPLAPMPLPQLAPHLLDRMVLSQAPASVAHHRFRTTIDARLQQQLLELASSHHLRLSGNGIHNLAILVLDVQRNEVMAYLGNAPDAGKEHGESVDVIPARRSSGSLLKPFLYAYMLQEGVLLPTAMVPDIPSEMSGYKPENYLETYDGVIPAQAALRRSLNIPFVKLLQQYSVEKFHRRLQKLGFRTIDRPPSYYGLPLVLGGAEISLWDVTNVYAALSRVLGSYYHREGKYVEGDYRQADYLWHPGSKQAILSNAMGATGRMQAAAIWSAFEAMQSLERPDAEGNWEIYQSARRVAWKTGTSFGFRDAWAVGVDPRYAVGIWVGNADGEGRPGLIGFEAAAPLLFDVFRYLPAGTWFDQPYDEMSRIPVCASSGYRAAEWCPVDTIWTPKAGLAYDPCPYHQLLHLDTSGRWQVNSNCAGAGQWVNRPWFVLPPVEEYYYKPRHPDYDPPPPYRADCLEGGSSADLAPFELIYPRSGTQIYVPLDFDSRLSGTVFKIAHREPETTVFWHIDSEFVGKTTHFHELKLSPAEGKHVLSLVDANGYRKECAFEILRKEH